MKRLKRFCREEFNKERQNLEGRRRLRKGHQILVQVGEVKLVSEQYLTGVLKTGLTRERERKRN